MMALELVGLPVLIAVIIGVVVFIAFGPAIAAWAESVKYDIKAAIWEIRENWRSKK